MKNRYSHRVASIRLDGESDDAFRTRAERAAVYAKLLVNACLQNACVRDLIADPDFPEWTESWCRQSPTVRIEYEQAIAIGGIGETLSATKSKHWGDGPFICPLQADDVFFPDRITYVYRENSLYHRRFMQRRRMKELLGKRYRHLVEDAKCRYTTKKVFLEKLTDEQARAIRQILNCEPRAFWRAAKGKTFLQLPPRPEQLYFDFMVNE